MQAANWGSKVRSFALVIDFMLRRVINRQCYY